MTIEQILTEAMKWPTPSRAYVAEKLLETLDFEEDVELSEEWLAEIRRRVATIEAGQAQMLPAEKVFAAIRRRLQA